MKFRPDSTFSHHVFTSGSSGHIIDKWERSEELWWLSLKSIDIATEAEPQASPAEARRTQHDNRISSSTKQLVRKMIFPLMTVIYTICICLLSKEGVEIYFHESHRFYGSKGDRYLKRRWKETFVSGHSRCLSPRFYFMRTTLERLFQTYY